MRQWSKSLGIADLRLGIIQSTLCRPLVGRPLIDVLRGPGIAAPQVLGAGKFPIGEFEPCGRAFELGRRLGEPNLVGNRVDGEEEITLVDDIAVLEADFRQRAADLGAQFDLINRGKLAEEAQPRVEVADQRSAHDHLRKRVRRRRFGGIALAV